MGTRRTAVVLFAVVVAVVAGVAAYEYLTTVQERANKNAKLVKVFVIKHDIAKGTPGERALAAGWIQSGRINVSFRPLTALGDIDAIRGKLAVTDLAANQIAVERQFVDPAVTPVTSAGRIPKNQVAIALSFDDVTGVAGLIQPGDRVNMLLMLENQERYLLQNVNVLFVGSRPAPEPGETPAPRPPEGQRSGVITFAVSPENAARIAYANARRQESAIHLTLVPPDNDPVPVPAISDANLIAGPLQTG